jgi:excinuclease ABC subunit B
MPSFKVVSDLVPRGDQPKAIEELSAAIQAGERFVTLLGITGSGKTATVAWTIERINRPTLVICPNKSLAAQFASELRSLMPGNKVEFFVSYYDYYQPEAYVPETDTYIEKDSSINDEIDRLRHSATAALLSRRDTVVVASVSAIYALGSPEEYRQQVIALRVGQRVETRSLARSLVSLDYDRADNDLKRGTFRIKGDVIDIVPPDEEVAVRIMLFDDEIERIARVDLVTGTYLADLEEAFVFPATHYVMSASTRERAIASIRAELEERLAELESQGKLLEAQRLRMRTENDLEMIAEMGYCKGIENYARHLDGRLPGQTPWTLLDYFPDDFLVVLDESHVTVPQLRGQYEGDRSRKQTLVDFGFRLPSALDNRPLKFEEFLAKAPQVVFVSATPGPFELEVSSRVVELIVRPTGLVDPEVEVRPTRNQVEDLVEEISATVAKGERVLVTTLTKRMAEQLTDHLLDRQIKVRYLHSDIDTVERIHILKDLRLGKFDVLVGVNLLREGLDLPEVSLVAILDADKEGFLRSSTSLIQTIGRAARNVSGKVILYADRTTRAMRQAIEETNRRREIQIAYNKEHSIEPETIKKAVNDILSMINTEGLARKRHVKAEDARNGRRGKDLSDLALEFEVAEAVKIARSAPADAKALARAAEGLEQAMHKAAAELKFELAARLRDELFELKREIRELLTYS